MKNLIQNLIITLSLSGSTALAAQYEIFVAQPVNETASRSEFSSLTQKSILIDTRSKTLKLPKAGTCSPHQLCGEAIHWVRYDLTEARYSERAPVLIKALNGSSQILITTTPDHSTLIQIINSKGSAEAQFIGSPVQPSRFLN